ncbi:MAG TPA: serine hydrolase domain-containing protein [Blastocatellia bacterium]|jgi:CubicO group peptidase (beta-lactamase class C family)|nr:serine hydrolase domain-containing protein [Blastocatellia bacterium]
MLRKYKYIAGILLVLMASRSGRAQAQTQANIANNAAACPQRAARPEEAFNAIERRNHSDIVGMCVGAVGPNYSETKCYGEILNGSGIAPTDHTLFWIGSVTKTMTATLLALRAREGTVDLNDRVDKYLPSNFHIPQITLLQLADMESGLQRNPPNPFKSPQDDSELYTDLQLCVRHPLCWAGVNQYSYSNFGYGVLGSVLANHDGPLPWSLDTFYYVMAPLGMFDSRVAQDFTSLEFSARRSYGHRRAGDAWTVLQTSSVSDAEAPAGGLWSTASDMLIWLKKSAQLHPTTNQVQLALKATMECRGPWGKNSTCSSVEDCGRCTGLAWTEDIDPCTGGIRISKSGSVPGFQAWIGFDKSTGRGVFVLLNSEAIKGDTVGEELLDLIP